MGAKFERQYRAGEVLQAQDLFGTMQALVGVGVSSSGRPKLPIRLMASLLCQQRLNIDTVLRWQRLNTDTPNVFHPGPAGLVQEGRSPTVTRPAGPPVSSDLAPFYGMHHPCLALVLEPIALASNGHDVRVVQQAVKQRRR